MAATRPREVQKTLVLSRRKHFLRKRRYADAFEHEGVYNIAEQLRDCEETEVLAACSSCAKSWYIINHCRLRVCPLCSYKTMKVREAFVHAMCRQMTHPKMLTLTMPRWTAFTPDGVKYIRECFTRLRRMKFMEKVVGGCYQVELLQKENGWHIHIHALMDAPYIPKQLIFTAWCKILGIGYANVDIEAATNDRQRKYICKYPVKSADFNSSPTAMVAWYHATKGVRLFSTFGKWFNARIEELDDSEEFEEFIPSCPNCGKEKTTYLARDGPYLYGHELWTKVRPHVVGLQPEMKALIRVRSALDAHKQTELELGSEND